MRYANSGRLIPFGQMREGGRGWRAMGISLEGCSGKASLRCEQVSKSRRMEGALGCWEERLRGLPGQEWAATGGGDGEETILGVGVPIFCKAKMRICYSRCSKFITKMETKSCLLNTKSDKTY